jgi:Fic family protein
MHSGKKIPVLVKAALIHHQFETIHPFLDGNGRTGRLLITLFLNAQGFVCSPFLYLSLFFKRHRQLYYEKLSYVRKTGDWESWINFFLEGAAVTATDAKKTLLAIQKVFAADDKKVSGLGRQRDSVAAVFAIFKRKPLLTIAEITGQTGFSKPTAMSAVNRLIDIGIIENVSEKKWRQFFVYSGYTELLAPDTGR